MERLDPFDLRQQLGHKYLRERHRSVLLTLSVVNRKNTCIEVEIVQAKLHAFEEPQAAAVQQLYYKVIGRSQMRENSIDFLTGENDRGGTALIWRGSCPCDHRSPYAEYAGTEKEAH